MHCIHVCHHPLHHLPGEMWRCSNNDNKYHHLYLPLPPHYRDQLRARLSKENRGLVNDRVGIVTTLTLWHCKQKAGGYTHYALFSRWTHWKQPKLKDFAHPDLRIARACGKHGAILPVKTSTSWTSKGGGGGDQVGWKLTPFSFCCLIHSTLLASH